MEFNGNQLGSMDSNHAIECSGFGWTYWVSFGAIDLAKTPWKKGTKKREGEAFPFLLWTQWTTNPMKPRTLIDLIRLYEINKRNPIGFMTNHCPLWSNESTLNPKSDCVFPYFQLNPMETIAFDRTQWYSVGINEFNCMIWNKLPAWISQPFVVRLWTQFRYRAPDGIYDKPLPSMSTLGLQWIQMSCTCTSRIWVVISNLEKTKCKNERNEVAFIFGVNAVNTYRKKP